MSIATKARRVVVTGTGWQAPPSLEALLTSHAPPAPPEITAFEIAEGLPTWGFEVLDLGLERELPHIKSFVDRTSALALVAAKRALADAGLPQSASAWGENTASLPPIGCAYGTMLGCLEAMGIFWHKVKNSNPKFAQPLPFTHGYANSPSSLMCIEFGLRGAAATFSGERLAGFEALLFAFDQIASGAAEIILAGASDSLTPAAHSHLYASGQLSATGTWDNGTIPGEGAAMLVLESLQSAQRRGARIYAEVAAVELGASLPIPPGGQPLTFASTQPHNQPGRIAPRLYAGDMLAALPILNAALAAKTLAGQALVSDTAPAAVENARAVGEDPGRQQGAASFKKWVEETA